MAQVKSRVTAVTFTDDIGDEYVMNIEGTLVNLSSLYMPIEVFREMSKVLDVYVSETTTKAKAKK